MGGLLVIDGGGGAMGMLAPSKIIGGGGGGLHPPPLFLRLCFLGDFITYRAMETLSSETNLCNLALASTQPCKGADSTRPCERAPDLPLLIFRVSPKYLFPNVLKWCLPTNSNFKIH